MKTGYQIQEKRFLPMPRSISALPVTAGFKFFAFTSESELICVEITESFDKHYIKGLGSKVMIGWYTIDDIERRKVKN